MLLLKNIGDEDEDEHGEEKRRCPPEEQTDLANQITHRSQPYYASSGEVDIVVQFFLICLFILNENPAVTSAGYRPRNF